jgi:hypothetical protein
MLQITIRVTLTVAGITAAIVVTNIYYAQAVECLARMENLAHLAIPTILALVLVYHVIQNSLGKNQKDKDKKE